jgi:hypothetical protein
MSQTSSGMLELAAIDLRYAQAEIRAIGDRDSILRSLDHIRQAEATLIVALSASGPPITDGGLTTRSPS